MVKKIKFRNQIFSKKELKQTIYDAFINYGTTRACSLADEMKELGFHYATRAGISISVEDLKVPPTKNELIKKANHDIKNSDLAYLRGDITSVERFQKVVDTWNKTSESLKDNLVEYFRQTDPLNSIYLMAFSGARGNLSQVRQLVGMRGLMSDPNGQILDIPIIHNFREGLTITDYIISSYGARKGVVDTALKTADSGYLTRRLIDVAQDIIVREQDCLTKRSIKIYRKGSNDEFSEKLVGRTCAETLYETNHEKIIIEKNNQITKQIAEKLIKVNIKSIKLHSPLTCESTRSICQKCYGWDLASGKLVKLGEAIGIIAAQSIGEPGTQLTMRTFHTGGIFTADPSRQIRAKTTGLFFYGENIQTKLSRTMYGTDITILEREAELTVIDYKNKKTQIFLPADSSIFIKNKTFIKKNELIAELPIKNQQTASARKNIRAPHSGELLLNKKFNLAWVLEGEVYNRPGNSLLNKFLQNQTFLKQDNILNFKLTTQKEGILKVVKNKEKKLKIIDYIELFQFPIFWDKKLKQLVLKSGKNDERYLIQDFSKTDRSELLLFANQTKNKYKTETGGQILYPDKSFFNYNSDLNKEVIDKNGKILFIPLENHAINKDKSTLLVENKTKLNNVGTEFVKGIFSKTDGFLQIQETEQVIREIQIKPGTYIEYLNLSEKEIEELKELKNKIYFPGEKIFEDILIEYLTLVEVIKVKNYYSVILRPIQEFNIPKPKKYANTNRYSIKFNFVTNLIPKLTTKQIKKHSLNLIESSIWIENKTDITHAKTDFVLRLTPCLNDLNNFQLTYLMEETITIKDKLLKTLANEQLKLSLFVKNLDYVEPNTVLGLISLIPKRTTKIQSFKTNGEGEPQILILGNQNYMKYYRENSTFYFKKDEMVKIDTPMAPLMKINCSGKIVELAPFQTKIHRGTPFFLTSRTELVTNQSGNYIKENELIGGINYDQIITGDIVQGLPKIEEILEARKAQNPAFLSQNAGIIKNINQDLSGISSIQIFGNTGENILNVEYNLSPRKHQFEDIIVKKNDYIYVGQPLTKGAVSPHTLLITYFEYYKKFGNDYEAAYLSFKNIQMLLIQKVQQVYNSQGVSIADKHLEVIIKRITSKVQINKTGGSLLLPGEILEIKQMEYINTTLAKSAKNLATYYPMLLGITKASLVTDSFISAASFQETTKILTAAAIEGKVDWLRGLKENVIIGRLIPVGTGFIGETKK